MNDLIYEQTTPAGETITVGADIDGVVMRIRKAGAQTFTEVHLPIAQAELLQLSLENFVVDAARSSIRAALAIHLASDKPKGCGGSCGSCGSCGHE